MTKQSVREILHQFAISYEVYSNEGREKSIDQALAQIRQIIEAEKKGAGSFIPVPDIRDIKYAKGYYEGFNQAIDTILDLFKTED